MTIEVVMALAKTLTTDQIVNHLDNAIQAYRGDKLSDKKKANVRLFAMMIQLHFGAAHMDIGQAIREVEIAKKASEFFHPKSN